PSYQWKLNGTDAGSDSASFITSTLKTGDQVQVVMTSTAGCVTTSTASSNTITMTVSGTTVVPAVSISTTANTVCQGTSVSFTAVPDNGGTAPQYQWQVNGSNTGTNSSVFTTSTLANNSQVKVIMAS